jgi:hypothetical protein
LILQKYNYNEFFQSLKGGNGMKKLNLKAKYLAKKAAKSATGKRTNCCN